MNTGPIGEHIGRARSKNSDMIYVLILGKHMVIKTEKTKTYGCMLVLGTQHCTAEKACGP